ncbi:hypothetical protein AB0K00_18225 [Dactylosporangium sp. NPDC049525]|uniref:hypothetical protein n=1 Tax=Dactylosporangium sp. NPDC049525 TaxID=3154730 RepID=UPI003436EB24
MQPGTSAGDGVALSMLQVTVGMPVVDSAGEQVGTVSAVQAPGTEVRPDTVAGITEHLIATGYLRIDGSGFLSNDVYAAGNQISGVNAGVVELLVPREHLYRAAS